VRHVDPAFKRGLIRLVLSPKIGSVVKHDVEQGVVHFQVPLYSMKPSLRNLFIKVRVQIPLRATSRRVAATPS
jgi:hypothetical protein